MRNAMLAFNEGGNGYACIVALLEVIYIPLINRFVAVLAASY